MHLYDPIPACLLGRYQLTDTTVFTALYSLVALVVSSAFLGGVWFSLDSGPAMWMTFAFYVLSLLLVVLSRFVMYAVRDRMQFSVFGFSAWAAAEAALLSGLYVLLTYLGSINGWIPDADHNYYALAGNAFLGIAICLGVPYIIAAQYFVINDKNNTIRLLNFESVAGDVQSTPQNAQKITLCDDTGVIKLVVGSNNLFYIESDDNYVKVWYEDASGSLKQYMLRCRLKTVEESFHGSGLVRCHRKYIVNMARVKLVERLRDGYYADLGLDGVEPIPVSKTYEESVLSIFNSR